MKYMPGEAIMRNRIRVLLIGLCLVVPVIMLGCSLDDNTGPTGPGGGTGNNPPGGGQASFNITVTANPPVLEATGLDIAQITVRVRDAATGRWVPNGTVVTLYTTMGRLNATGLGEGALTLGMVALNGRVDVFLISGINTGTAVVTASVGNSTGYVNVPFVAPPEP
jgi:hypothetical protein